MSLSEISEATLNLFEGSCIELFESLGCSIKVDRTTTGLSDDAITAFIDAGNEDIDTGILLRIPEHVLALTYPSSVSEEYVSEAELEDWVGELANRLIGLFKSALIKHNCFVTIGLPVTYVGVDPAELLPANVPVNHFQFDIDNELCECQVSVQVFNENLDLSSDSNDGSDDTDNGDLEFF